jgi:hypothetical protein
MSEAIVTISDFEQYKPIPKSLQGEDFQPFIIRVQRDWLRRQLGKALYRDMTQNQDVAKYATLIQGGTATDSSGNTIDFFGLLPAVVYYAYADYLKQNDLKLTPAGSKTKKSNSSDMASKELIDSEYNKAMQNAYSYMTEVVDFLNDNKSTYSLFSGQKAVMRGSIRIGRVERQDFYSEDDNYKYGNNGGEFRG